MILNSIDQILNENAPCVFVEVISATSGTPCKAGFKMIVNQQGRVEGSVGGGILEKTCIEIAQKMILENEKINLYTFTLKNDLPTSIEKDIFAKDINKDIMQDIKKDIKKDIKEDTNEDDKNSQNLYAACGGKVTIFFEHYQVLTLSIFGAGHIGENLVNIIDGIGYKINIFDVREDILEKYKEKSNIRTFLIKPKEKDNEQIFFVDDKPLSEFLQPQSYIVITTHGHTYDFSIAKYLLKLDKKFKYIGMIGSKNKIRTFVENLKINEPDIYQKLISSNFYSPIGIDIGGITAKEIALSIASQIQAVRYDKDIKDLSLIKDYKK